MSLLHCPVTAKKRVRVSYIPPSMQDEFEKRSSQREKVEREREEERRRRIQEEDEEMQRQQMLMTALICSMG